MDCKCTKNIKDQNIRSIIENISFYGLFCIKTYTINSPKPKLKKSSLSMKAAPPYNDESSKIKESKATKNSPYDFAVAEKDDIKNAEEKMRQLRGKKL